MKEFENMPSCEYNCTDRLNKENIHRLDISLIKSICRKHNVMFKLVGLLWGNYDIHLEHLKTSNEENDFKEMHSCLNELDICTPIYFSNGWVGNCGRFSEFDIAYSDGRFYKEKNGIKTILCKVNSLKPLIIDTPILNDDSLLNIIKKILHKISIEFESERKEPFNMLIKLSNKEPHKFNIYYDNVHFHGYLIVYRDTITHQYSIEHFVVLAGRTRFPIDYFKLEDEIEEALRYICF